MTSYLRSIIALIILAFTSLLSAQDIATIQGRVYDVDTDQPIAFTTIYMDGTSNATESNDDGSFKFEVTLRYCSRMG